MLVITYIPELYCARDIQIHTYIIIIIILIISFT